MNRFKDSVLGQNRRLRFPGRSINSQERWTSSKTLSWDKIDDADSRDGASTAKKDKPAQKLCPGTKSTEHQQQRKMNRLKDSVLGQNRRCTFPGRSINSKERWTSSNTLSWEQFDDADSRDGAATAKKDEPAQRLCPGTKSTTQIPGTVYQQKREINRLKYSVLGENRELRFPGQSINTGETR